MLYLQTLHIYLNINIHLQNTTSKTFGNTSVNRKSLVEPRLQLISKEYLLKVSAVSLLELNGTENTRVDSEHTL